MISVRLSEILKMSQRPSIVTFLDPQEDLIVAGFKNQEPEKGEEGQASLHASLALDMGSTMCCVDLGLLGWVGH
jgi:hypothetical protein